MTPVAALRDDRADQEFQHPRTAGQSHLGLPACIGVLTEIVLWLHRRIDTIGIEAGGIVGDTLREEPVTGRG